MYTTLYSVRGLAGAGSPSTWVTGSSSAILVVFMPTWRPRCCVARCSSSAALTHDAIATAANRQQRCVYYEYPDSQPEYSLPNVHAGLGMPEARRGGEERGAVAGAAGEPEATPE